MAMGAYLFKTWKDENGIIVPADSILKARANYSNARPKMVDSTGLLTTRQGMVNCSCSGK